MFYIRVFIQLHNTIASRTCTHCFPPHPPVFLLCMFYRRVFAQLTHPLSHNSTKHTHTSRIFYHRVFAQLALCFAHFYAIVSKSIPLMLLHPSRCLPFRLPLIVTFFHNVFDGCFCARNLLDNGFNHDFDELNKTGPTTFRIEAFPKTRIEPRTANTTGAAGGGWGCRR